MSKLQNLPVIHARGILFIADPHLASTAPGQRLEGYDTQVLDKLEACFEHAFANNFTPVIAGDLFHWPRDNSNALLVAIMQLFSRFTPWVLVGNHDKYQARFTDDVSLAVLKQAGVCRVIEEAGPVFRLETNTGSALLGASPDMTPLPRAFDPEGVDEVLWITHHNIGFPDIEEPTLKPHPIPGVDWVVNGHIHREQPVVETEGTRWMNIGGLTRLSFSPFNVDREPSARIWTPGCTEMGRFVPPFLEFSEVFPDQDFPQEIEDVDRESKFVQGLERLAWKRTREGAGLKQFLEDNLDPDTPESTLIWELYQEVTSGE